MRITGDRGPAPHAKHANGSVAPGRRPELPLPPSERRGARESGRHAADRPTDIDKRMRSAQAGRLTWPEVVWKIVKAVCVEACGWAPTARICLVILSAGIAGGVILALVYLMAAMT
jgi:hypothetical protein